MILFELVGSESHPAYQQLHIENLSRQYDFLQSAVHAHLAVSRFLLSSEIIKAFNYHAIACLHVSAGEYRPCAVRVNKHVPPEFYQVPALMSMFIDEVNRHWETSDPIYLAAYVLWRLNHIHPFINGNGRTARVACYFVLCLKVGTWLPGTTTLPELIRQNRPEYVAALEAADASLAHGQLDLTALHVLLQRLVETQLASAPQEASP